MYPKLLGPAVVGLLFAIVGTTLGAIPCSMVPVRSCPDVELSGKAELIHVFIDDCTEEPCNFLRGQTVAMEMDIVFHEPVKELKAELHALLGAAPIPWNGVNPRACEDIVSEGQCPLKEGDYITYGVSLGIEPSYPQVRTDVRYRIKDEDDNILVCWIVKAQVR